MNELENLREKIDAIDKEMIYLSMPSFTDLGITEIVTV